ncbi:alpha/beta hydrolase [Streptomyces sp. Li-HN-5-11]|uniref:alpha/beta hydrolase n=1 Tax=Streptomyces sp. Li-HN-5-11 TaxID=3075432 RepID=UPI0028AA72C2|nr:alpha/beta hydrolase [Streptomyces sp. Li-HN-5-11]WNM34781.1 alpha/beta hydrolase [Streptomyces sp. Li-HN-5-11]
MSAQMRVVAAYLRLARATGAFPPAQQDPPRPPRRLARRHRVAVRHVGAFECHTVLPRDRTTERAVLYLHGGSYVSHMSPQHWQLISRMADAAIRVEVPHYGLAPRYTHRDAYPFVTAVYRELLAGTAPDRTAIVGDSAGGGLALGLTQTLTASRLPQPGRLVLIAPWLDVTLTNPGIAALESHDPMLSRADLLAAARGWAGGDDPALPRLSPVNGPLSPLPPTDVYIGTRDLFLPDVRRLADRAAAAGTTMNVVTCEGGVHDYPLVPAPEGRAAARAIVRSVSLP